MRLLLLIVFGLGLALMLLALSQRVRAGFGRGRVISRDDVLLVSRRYGLTGRPDRIVKVGRHYIPEEKKQASRSMTATGHSSASTCCWSRSITACARPMGCWCWATAGG